MRYNFYLDANVWKRIISSAAVINYHAAEINTVACCQHKPVITTLDNTTVQSWIDLGVIRVPAHILSISGPLMRR